MSLIGYKLKLAVLTMILILANCLTYGQQDKIYQKELKAVLTFARDSIFKEKGTLIMADYLCNEHYFLGCIRCLDKGFEKEQIFPEDEIGLAYLAIRDSSKYPLSHSIIERAKFINDEKKHLASIVHFSKPIFLRDYSYCVFNYSIPFESEYHTDGWGEGSATLLLKKQGQKWTFLKILQHHYGYD